MLINEILFLLCAAITIPSIKMRNVEFQRLFTTKNYLSYCTEVDVLFNLLDVHHVPNDWRLFIDVSTKSSASAQWEQIANRSTGIFDRIERIQRDHEISSEQTGISTP